MGRRSGIFIVNFEHISYPYLVFTWLTLSKYLFAKNAFYYFADSKEYTCDGILGGFLEGRSQ